MSQTTHPEPIGDETQPASSPSGGHVVLIGARRPFAALTSGLRAASVEIDHLPASISSDQLDALLAQQQIDLIAALAGEQTDSLFSHLHARGCPAVRVALAQNAADIPSSLHADFVYTLDSPILMTNLISLIRLSRRTTIYMQPSQQTATPSEIDLLRDTIVKTVSHELRTPLLQIKSAVAMLSEGAAERERLMGYALGAVSRLENVISNITRLAESLNTHIDITTPSDVLLHTMRLLRRNWESREQLDRIQTIIAPDLPHILCDRAAISVALQLLLDNALKFSTDAVTFEIRPSPHGSVEFRVIDQGIGIAPALRERIFEPFFQADQHNTRKYRGAGVGLAIVRLILERHHTAIHIESRLGEGSTFTFALPRVPPDTLPG